MYYREGWRFPEYAYYKGNKTSLVLLPISQPIISEREGIPDKKVFFEVIDTAAEHDDIVVFRFDSIRLKDSKTFDLVLDIFKYAKKKCLNFTTPFEIANHFRLLENISVYIFKTNNKMKILIRNDNSVPVRGITLKVKMPEGSFIAKGCKIVRETHLTNKQIFYLSVDLAPKEERKIILLTQN